jgi:hypothetical protein
MHLALAIIMSQEALLPVLCRSVWVFAPQDQRVQAYCILAVLKIEEATYTCESRPKSPYPFYSTGRGSDVGEHGTNYFSRQQGQGLGTR